MVFAYLGYPSSHAALGGSVFFSPFLLSGSVSGVGCIKKLQNTEHCRWTLESLMPRWKNNSIENVQMTYPERVQIFFDFEAGMAYNQ